MSQIVEATYDGSVLLPDTTLEVAPNTRVRITVESLTPQATEPLSFLDTAQSLNLNGPPDWSENLDEYLDGRANSAGR